MSIFELPLCFFCFQMIAEEEANRILFDFEDYRPDTIQEIWANKVVQVVESHPDKHFLGMTFITTAPITDKIVTCYYLKPAKKGSGKKPEKCFEKLKHEAGLLIIGLSQV